MISMPKTAEERKQHPVTTGVLDYFPDAILAIANVSLQGNEQHNPGQPLHWDRSKSQDEADALVRHLMERGTKDSDGTRHSAKMAWRALALLQKEIEEEEKEKCAYCGGCYTDCGCTWDDNQADGHKDEVLEWTGVDWGWGKVRTGWTVEGSEPEDSESFEPRNETDSQADGHKDELAEEERLDSVKWVLDRVRAILRVPEMKSIILHAEEIMREGPKCEQCGYLHCGCLEAECAWCGYRQSECECVKWDKGL